MPNSIEINLRDGTLVRHKTKGYEGKIEGTTAIEALLLLQELKWAERDPAAADTLQLQVEAFRYAWQDRLQFRGDPEKTDVPLALCIRCQKSFYSKPGLTGKAGGRCACGAWICPVCMGCQTEEAAQNKATSCTHQRKRFLKKLASEKN